MAALTREQRLARNALILKAARHHPGNFAGAIAEGMHQFRKGLSEAMAPNTSTNKLNDSALPNSMTDAGGNSFEQFLTDMIELIAAKAAAEGRTNPAYTQLAARLAAAQAMTMNGVQRSSYVSPAAGSTPVGRTESAPASRFLAEALALAATHLPSGQGTPARPAAALPPPKALDQMTPAELQHEHMARLGLLHSEGALKSPFYSSAAA